MHHAHRVVLPTSSLRRARGRGARAAHVVVALAAALWVALTSLVAPASLLAAPPPRTAAPVSTAPRLVGSQPHDGGKLYGNTVALLFEAIPVGAAAPTAVVIDLGRDDTRSDGVKRDGVKRDGDKREKGAVGKEVAARTTMHCRDEAKARRCMVSVQLALAVEGHRYRVEVLEAKLTVLAVDGHPGDRR